MPYNKGKGKGEENMTASFTSKPSLGVNYYDKEEKGLFLDCIGYDDFRFVAPRRTPRRQQTYTLHFVLSGSGHLYCGGTYYSVGEGDMFFLPPDVEILYYPKEEDPWRYIWCSFVGEDAALYRAQLGFGASPVLHAKNKNAILREVYEVFSRLDRGESVGYYAALAMFYRIVDSEHEEPAAAGRLSDRVKSYLAAHYHDPRLSVEDVCRDFHISHSYLCRVYKSETGETVKATLTGYRIAAAERLLHTGELSVSGVGYAVGFSDHAHFMKTFKKAKGVSAGAYKRSR